MSNLLPLVVLAGGFGTRLQGVIADKPKPMAPIGEKPFLEYLLQSALKTKSVSKIILSVGYLHEQIIGHFGTSFDNVPIEYSIEETPLGTGGAVAKALTMMSDEDFFIVNGDTLFPIDISCLRDRHYTSNADVSIALKQMYQFDRYGTVLYEDGTIKRFKEKQRVENGLINGGVYVLKKQALLSSGLAGVFSLEKDFLQALVGKIKVAGVIFEEFFIDIGIPEDFRKAQKELPILKI